MSERPTANDEDRAALIAYLDGELDEEASRELEARLSRDPAARAELEALRQTWELLDYLPATEPSPEFTHRTLERVTAQRAAADAARRRRRRWGAALGWVAAVLLAAAVGFGGVSLLPRDPTDEDLARDLRLIENKRLYEQVDDVEFLRELDHPDLFGEDPADTGG
jgi:anti-sigma factor RsiW